MEPAKYILTHRLAKVETTLPGNEALHEHLYKLEQNADVVSDTHGDSTDRKEIPRPDHARRSVVLHGASDHFESLQKSLHEHVILEPHVTYESHQHPHRMGGRPTPQGSKTPKDIAIDITVVSPSGEPIVAEVNVQYSQGTEVAFEKGNTNSDGKCTIHLDKSCTVLLAVASPAYRYWTGITQLAPSAKSATIICEPLPNDGPLGWWHHFLGVDQFDPSAGNTARIGIIGTGVNQHPNLAHVDRIDAKEDLSSHGTHVCGLIAARPSGAGQFAGIAPGAEILTQRVFEFDQQKNELKPPNQVHLAHAIDEFSGFGIDKSHRVDIINMSLGGSKNSSAVHDAVEHAFDHGTVCVCSSGNSALSQVEFPAALRKTVAVSAIGKCDWGSKNSSAQYWVPQKNQKGRFGRDDICFPLYNCYGDNVVCVAPGNGIISTVPPSIGYPAPYASMDGTSLASPLVAGLLAVLLSNSPTVQKLALDAVRSKALLDLLSSNCQAVGLDEKFEGQGMPEC